MIQTNLKYIFSSLFTIPLLPLLYIQGKRIKSSVPRLPEATGISGTENIKGDTTLRMLTIGESTIAGVGVETHKEGFSGTLAKSLSESLNTIVDWKVYARSGYTVERVIHKIVPKIKENSIDLIVIGMGGNDAFALNSPWKWKQHIFNLITALRLKFGDTPIVFTNMPPIKDFPAFTSLIKFTMGNLVLLYNQELQLICRTENNVYFNSEVVTLSHWIKKMENKYESKDFFSDGVHPSKLTYQTWANEMARFIKPLLKNNN